MRGNHFSKDCTFIFAEYAYIETVNVKNLVFVHMSVQNHRQKVFNRGLRICVWRLDILKIDKNSTNS